MAAQRAIYCAGVTVHDFGVLKASNFKQLTCHSCFGPPTCKTLVRFKINLQHFLNYRSLPFLREHLSLLDQQTKALEEVLGALLCRELWDFPQRQATRCYLRMADMCQLNSLRRRRMARGRACIVFERFCFEKYEPKIIRSPAAAYV